MLTLPLGAIVLKSSQLRIQLTLFLLAIDIHFMNFQLLDIALLLIVRPYLLDRVL